MTKKLLLRKEDVRRSHAIDLPPIPINQYQKNFYNELEHYGRERLRMVFYDMQIIREFESMLNLIKTKEEYQGIHYKHLGPAHLSIGQESAVVGQCMELDIDDLIFGSHRSHGEIIAKCLAVSRMLKEDELRTILEQYREGRILKILEQTFKIQDMYELAEYFILYGLLAEIFARETGFNAGLGGSMHAFFVPFGSMPNNALVGGSADIALGAALFKKVNAQPGIVIANIGDAAMACGPVWEALVFSSMDQYQNLWNDQEGAPPYLLNVFNNFYGMGGQTVGETMGMGVIARIASGINSHSMHAERVDGFNPLAVADAIRRKKELLVNGEGPVLLDTITYRVSGHSPSDASSYRTKEELDDFRINDPIVEYKDYLHSNNVISNEVIDSFSQDIRTKMKRILQIVKDESLSPFVEAKSIAARMFSNKKYKAQVDLELAARAKDNPRVMQIAKKKRFAKDADGKRYPAIQLYSLRDAIFEAVLHAAITDPRLVIYGEENRDWGGPFACYRGLTELLPYHKLFNPPITEAAIVGTGVGYALCGGRALVELMYCDFLGRAGDEVFNQMPKWQSMSASVLEMPLVLRISVGNKYGAQHSQDWSALVAHIPGLQVMYAATPYDAKGMLAAALASSDPVIFFESQKIYGVGEEFYSNGVPEEYYEIELGKPIRRREGRDLSIITLGPTLYPALEAAEQLSSQYHIESDIIDLRFINPLQYDCIIESVQKTGKVLLVSDAVERGSFMHTVASHITRVAFDYLDAAPCVVGAENWITPPAELEKEYFPTKESILDTIDQNLIKLKNHKSKNDYSAAKRLYLNSLGI